MISKDGSMDTPKQIARFLEMTTFGVKKEEIDSLLNEIMSFIRSVNVYMEKNQPWKIVKEDKEAAGHVLYHAAESLRVAAIMLSPVMPEKSQEIMIALGATEFKLDWAGLKPGDKISKGDPIFPRIVQ